MKSPLIRRFPVALLVISASALSADVALKPGAYTERIEISGSDFPKPMVTSSEQCFTVEQARTVYSKLLAELAKDEDCKQSNVKSEGGKVSFDMMCPDIIDGPSNTHAEMTFGPDWYKAQTTNKQGKTVINVKLDAKWVRASCAGKP